ncbi:MAG: pyridoxal 5'-phosphate synthase glutaminase subunit PdxT [Armatimonadetes bacterium]|nr:pyridoxal 5'-phosphate synthase glutaminase subunit PdxT [Armatimonadota bacterium]
MVVGVLAIQGDFEKHLSSLSRCSQPPETLEVRTEAELARIDRLIIPGGESTTVGLLLERYGLGPAIQQRAEGGMPIWGTCMGMIMLAAEVEGSSQYRLGLMDVTVRRNAFGAQVHSFEDTFAFDGQEVTGVFIRAPIVTSMGPGVSELARYSDQIVAVRQGNRVGTSFHPELTDDVRLHEWFLKI